MATKGNDTDEIQHKKRLGDIESKPSRKLMPIQGYADKDIVSLEEAVKPLVSLVQGVENQAKWAKWASEDIAADHLTQDESAAIRLYTADWEPQDKCLYYVLNATLRDENRQKLKPWFSFLKLFLTALGKVPLVQDTVYRGIRGDLRDQYQKGSKVTWWSFSSCTQNIGTLKNEQFFGKEGPRTLFNIRCNNGRDIRPHSAFEDENEVLLPAARQFEVVDTLEQSAGLYIVQLREIKSSVCLLELEPSVSYFNTL